MNAPFRFKQFEIIQEINPHKVGTDSMLLGAWSKSDARRILDIGTGTGMLALMMAQNHEDAQITAIEANEAFCLEAEQNFSNSIFNTRILAIHSSLQSFTSINKFDFIICNPPYFDGSYKSQNTERNSVRHDDHLLPNELFEHAADLLSNKGLMNIIIPFDREEEYLKATARKHLYPQKILRTVIPSGGYKRSLISFARADIIPTEEEILIKDSENRYSVKYIEMTKVYHATDLSI
ncbi:methyltransferase [Crocinitomix catalasitica]|nr:methyltransferase [Crocinitomix catalasitica]